MLNRFVYFLFTFSLGVSVGQPADAQLIHPFNLPQPPNAPETLLAVIEIPEGSQAKYEIDPKHGGLMVDRLLPDTHRYPAHYGGLPSLYAADGDLMDVLVITTAALVPGALIEVVPIGLARMLDGGERDDKVVAIPIGAISIGSSQEAAFSSVDAKVLETIEYFFKTYKATDNKPNPIEWQGYVGHQGVMDWWQDIRAAGTKRSSEKATSP